MASKQELFTKVTGLTCNVEDITDESLLSWVIPAGAMLGGDIDKNQKAKDTLELCEALGVDPTEKFGEDVNYDDNDNGSDDDLNSYDDLNSGDDPKSTADVQVDNG